MNFEDDSDNLLAQIQEKRTKRRNLFDQVIPMKFVHPYL